ncbi:MAG: exo-beta-N-acetylmuramidase NamZ domain-containing protein [Verrucomicrobiales bacterium]
MKLIFITIISYYVLLNFYLLSAVNNKNISLGIDELEKNEFVTLKGKRVGLITNQTGVNSKGVKTRTILFNSEHVNLVSLFTPEHGLDGNELAGKWVPSRVDSLTGLKAFSLYGKTRKPNPVMLNGIDVLVFDIQDVGVRCYTYISTMVLCMEAAADKGIEFIVLDRPNPVTGNCIEGPPIVSKWQSFVGQLPIPFRHGLTVGEIAKMAVGENWLKSNPKLKVIKMNGWNRDMSWVDTGLNWVQTSPNIPRAKSCYYYLLSCIPQHVKGVYAGTGGSHPFEHISTSGVSSDELVDQLNLFRINGLKYKPYKDENYPMRGGMKLIIDDDYKGELVTTGLTILKEILNQAERKDIDLISSKKGVSNSLLYKVYGSDFIGNNNFRKLGMDAIIKSWQPFLNKFKSERKNYLLYR